MKILNINTFDTGGAAKACLRLHLGLLASGIHSKVLLKQKTNFQIPETYQISLSALENNLSIRIIRKLTKISQELGIHFKDSNQDILSNLRPRGLEVYSYPTTDIDLTKSELYKQSDLINLHLVARFLNYKSFFTRNKKPLVWTLHDQNPFLGVEHFAESHLGIDEKGYPIKRVVSKNEMDIYNRNLKLKKEALQHIPQINIVSPSIWLAKEAQKSELFNNFPISIIPNGVNSEIFKPRDRRFSRELLNIPHEKIVILFVADNLSNQRKGFEYLSRALSKILNKNITFVSIGPKNLKHSYQENHIELGQIHDELLLSIIYSAADVFAIPSLMDNLPNTVLEALMCGTPVIGFPVGGIPDMVIDGENGYLTNDISVVDLIQALTKFIDNPTIFDRIAIRTNAVKKYSLDVQAKAYIKLYQSILK